MPTVFAASTIRVPAATASLWPSIVRLTSGMRCDLAFVPERVVLVLAVEVAESRVDDPARRITEPAEAAAVLQRVRDAAEVVQLNLRPVVAEDALVHAHRPVAPDAAGRALAARLVGVELEKPVRRPHDAVRVVHHDHAARAAHRLRGR